MFVELRDSNGDWHLLEGAAVSRLVSGFYEVTVSGVAATLLGRLGLFDELALRVDGQEVPVIVAAKRESGDIVFRAFAETETPTT